MIRRRRSPSNVWSISCTDAEWETVRRYAGRHGVSISRWLVGSGLKGDPDAILRPSQHIALSDPEQRNLYDNLTLGLAVADIATVRMVVIAKIVNGFMCVSSLVQHQMWVQGRAGDVTSSSFPANQVVPDLSNHAAAGMFLSEFGPPHPKNLYTRPTCHGYHAEECCPVSCTCH